jgi:membrane protein YqaA with SNARE-associated domain
MPRLPLFTFGNRHPYWSCNMKLWQFIKQQYDFVIRTAQTPLATRLMLLYSALESIIIPFPVDPLLIAVVLAKSNHWWRIAFSCTIASVVGGAGGWALGAYLGMHIYALIDSLPVLLAAPSAFAAVEAGFAELGLVLVFLGAFSPLPYKVIAMSAGIGGFGLLPFLLMSFIGRGLRFSIVAAIACHHGDAKKLISLVSLLVALFAGAIWLTK